MNSGHLRSRFCYFDTLLPLASCRKLDPLRTPRADISVGPFSLGKAVLCLGLRPTSSNPRPSGAPASPARAFLLLQKCANPDRPRPHSDFINVHTDPTGPCVRWRRGRDSNPRWV